ncbi:hypothetical protein [Streptomyces ortus]|uniref:DUF222 domain-containing protein n=1 Tax=Streptomyces ortus TaxID=2867268 RepID=A0ABT3UW40_9ACTN|nr:hypothetical protein [Streptomyces ortus]MCX4231802.1 hypothetical protein [Streptomyces ortus]
MELLKLRSELEKTTPGKSAADMLAAVLAVQQERTGGQADRVVLRLDEAADLFRESGLFPGRTPEGVRTEIERLIRTGRKPYPTETAGEAFAGETSRGTVRLQAHRLSDLDGADNLPTWMGPARGSVPMVTTDEALEYLQRENATELTPEHLVRQTLELARTVAVGDAPKADVMQLAELVREVARRCNAERARRAPPTASRTRTPGSPCCTASATGPLPYVSARSAPHGRVPDGTGRGARCPTSCRTTRTTPWSWSTASPPRASRCWSTSAPARRRPCRATPPSCCAGSPRTGSDGR